MVSGWELGSEDTRDIVERSSPDGASRFVRFSVRWRPHWLASVMSVIIEERKQTLCITLDFASAHIL